ncbi:MAG: hypothetical protein AB4352_05085 [Hormoscilla sp.]
MGVMQFGDCSEYIWAIIYSPTAPVFPTVAPTKPRSPPDRKKHLWDMRNPVTLNLPSFWDLSSQGYMTTYWLTGRKRAEGYW